MPELSLNLNRLTLFALRRCGALILILILGLAIAGAAARSEKKVHFVRAGATGDGSNWERALPELPRELARGHTYYVAAGKYPGRAFADPEDGDKRIWIKRATADDHGTDQGWNREYGAGKATFGPLSFSRSYYVFEGAVGSGRSGHGFEICGQEGVKALFELTNAVHDITLRHTELHFSSRALSGGDAIYGNTPAKNIIIAACSIHDIPRCPFLMRNWRNVLLEQNWIARNKSTPEIHSEGISTHGGGDFIIRNNVWEDIEGTAIIVNLAVPTRNWKIYGNVFVQTDGAQTGGLGHGVVSDNFENSAIDGLEFFNNTIVGLRGGAAGLQFWAKESKNIKAINNIWVRCENIAFTNVEYGYNQLYASTTTYAYRERPGFGDAWGIGDPFVAPEKLDFRLRMPTEPGLALTEQIYAKDPDGRQRGAGGVWCRGAYEYAPADAAKPVKSVTKD